MPQGKQKKSSLEVKIFVIKKTMGDQGWSVVLPCLEKKETRSGTCYAHRREVFFTKSLDGLLDGFPDLNGQKYEIKGVLKSDWIYVITAQLPKESLFGELLEHFQYERNEYLENNNLSYEKLRKKDEQFLNRNISPLTKENSPDGITYDSIEEEYIEKFIVIGDVEDPVPEDWL